MTFPRLNLQEFAIKDLVDHAFIIDQQSDQEVEVGAETAVLLRCIDGETSPESILSIMRAELDRDISMTELWQQLDMLADIGILDNYLAPPSSGQKISRRGALSILGVTAAAGALAPQLAAASEKDDKKSKESYEKKTAESKSKEEQTKKKKKDPKGSEKDKKQAEKQQKKGAEKDQKNPNEKGKKNQSSEQDKKPQQEQGAKEENAKRKQKQQEQRAKEQKAKTHGKKKKKDPKSAELEEKKAAEEKEKSGIGKKKKG